MERQEVIINARDLIYSVIRRWRVLVLAALIGCAAAVGYQFLPKKASPAAAQSGSESGEQSLSIEQQISEKKGQLEANTQKIEANRETIVRKEEAVAEQEQALEENGQLIEEYQKVLSAAEDALKTAAPEAQGEIVLAMNGANDGIRDLQSKNLTIRQEIINLQQEAADLQQEADTALPQANERLTREIEALEKSAAEAAEQKDDAKKDAKRGISAGGLAVGALAGMLAGVILSGGYLFVRYCLERKLHDAGTLRMRYQYFILGSLYKPSEKGGRLDRAFADWAGYPFELDEEKAYGVIAANITVLEEKPETILLTGTVPAERLQRIGEEIGKRLAANGITIQVHPDAASSPEGILRIKNSPVIVAEAKDWSRLGDMDRQDELIAAAGARVVGAILI